MITTPLLEKYRNGDFIQYMNNVLDLVTEARAATLNLAPQRTALYNGMQEMNTLWQPARGSEITPQIAQLDTRRDSIFSGLKMTADAWAHHHYDDAQRNAAILIADNMAAHGHKIQDLRYQEETAVLNAILNDLENEYSDAVSLLGLAPWVSELRSVNTEFNDLYVARTQALSTQQTGAVETQRNQVTTDFRGLKTLFEARMAVAEVDGGANLSEFETVHNEWSTLSGAYNDAVTRYAHTDTTEEPEEAAENDENT